MKNQESQPEETVKVNIEKEIRYVTIEFEDGYHLTMTKEELDKLDDILLVKNILHKLERVMEMKRDE